MKKKVFVFGSLPFLLSNFTLTSCKGADSRCRDEFNSYINNLEKFPCSFSYDGVMYHGLNKLELLNHENNKIGVKEQHILTFKLDVIKVIVDTNYYDGYDAFDWTIYFKNESSFDSKIISDLNGLDYTIDGANAHLKGIYGDHEKQYEPYNYDLSHRQIDWRNDLGRATHRYFPYFNLENDNGGALMALGWAGTWESKFNFDSMLNKTNVKFNAVLDLATFLKPNETIRSSLNAVVRYYQKDEDAAMNKWRRWYIDCNMPYQDKTHTKKVQPMQAFCLAFDNDNPFNDGSTSETYLTYKPSLDCLRDEKIRVDVRWLDAGWYLRPDKKPTPINDKTEWNDHYLDWWGTVGTWEMDTGKWPINNNGESTFLDSVKYATDQNNAITMVWFEPERIAAGTSDCPHEGNKYLDNLCENYGFDKSYLLEDMTDYSTNILNLGKTKAYEWVKTRVISALKNYKIKLYREDFNCDPGRQFRNNDQKKEGSNRTGITENLYYQGHYKLWDEIIKTTSETNEGCAFIDSCAAGGGRNDLESMRRAVPMLRSDADRTTISLRLAYSYSLNPWLPFTGCFAKESTGQLTSSNWDQYILRASYMSSMAYTSKFSMEKAKLDYNVLRNAQKEWEDINPYFYKDYYNLTPYTLPDDDRHWNAYMYFDKDKDDGVIQVFRQEKAINESNKIIKIKGVVDNHNYQIVDKENKNGYVKISGAQLKQGINIELDKVRGSAVLFVKPI